MWLSRKQEGRTMKTIYEMLKIAAIITIFFFGLLTILKISVPAAPTSSPIEY